MKTQHFICNVWDDLNPSTTPVQARYFDGTQAQAIKHFKRVPEIKKYLKNDRYSVYMRANSVDLKEC